MLCNMNAVFLCSKYTNSKFAYSVADMMTSAGTRSRVKFNKIVKVTCTLY